MLRGSAFGFILPVGLAALFSSSAAGQNLAREGTFRDCPECPEMVVAPVGEFLMGSPENEMKRERDEGPQRTVTFAKPFATGRYEVTFAEWDVCVADGGCTHKPGDEGWGRDRRPVINVSWDDAKEYVAWLSKRTGKPYRLPSEAEWEYATRGATTAQPQPPYHFGGDLRELCAYGNGADQTGQSRFGYWTIADCKDGYVFTAPVGSFKANAFGLHDMHGNVWEWVEDCYGPNYEGAPTDGTPVTSGDCRHRVVRGGSWGFYPWTLRAAYRLGDRPISRNGYTGFRVAKTLGP